MRYFFHGENSPITREKLNELKSRFATLPQAIFAPGKVLFSQEFLFLDPKFYLLEFFEKADLRGFNWAELFRFLDSKSDEVFAIWAGFEVNSSEKISTLYRHYQFQEVKINLSNQVFKTVDAFFEQKSPGQSFYSLINSRFLQNDDLVFLIQMLIRRVRQVLWQKLTCKAVESLKSFTKTIVSENAHRLNLSQSLSLYRSLLDLERKVKTSEDDVVGKLLLLYEDFKN